MGVQPSQQALGLAALLALGLEALVAAGHWRQNQASVTDHLGELERPQYVTGCGDAANWSLFESGAPAPAAPLAIARGQAPEPTILVSDEIAACGAHVRRLRFFDSTGAGEDEREDESMVSCSRARSDPSMLVNRLGGPRQRPLPLPKCRRAPSPTSRRRSGSQACAS